LPANPVVEVGVGRRREADGRTDLDRTVDLAQTFEVGGQRGARVAAAQAELRGARASAAAVEREIVAAVFTAAAEISQARDELRFATEESEAAALLVAVSAGRAREGAGSAFDLDLAQANRVAARRRERDARRALGGAEAALVELAGEELRLAPQAALPPPFQPAGPLAALERQAVAARGEVAVTVGEVEASRARLSLLRRERAPAITLAASLKHEELATIVGGRLAVSLPLFQRNQGEIAEQRARLAQAEATADQATLRVRLEVRAAHLAWQQAAAIVAEVPGDLEARLAADVRSLRDAYARGAMPMPALIAALREAFSARRAVAAARLEALAASFELARVTGGSLTAAGASAR
jgi:cobalt-zinc-cadmium efflux system outer membrane protein